MSAAALRVLIADDSAELRAVIGSLLERAGIVVAGEAEGAADAVEQAARLEPDVVVLDAAMPGPPAHEVIDRLRDLERPPGVVVYSGWPAAELATLQAPVVAKSSDPALLVEEVRRVGSTRTDE